MIKKIHEVNNHLTTFRICIYEEFFFTLQAEDQCENLSKDVVLTKKLLYETEEEKKRLETESAQV